jgi:NodT family efflux transporter outer membrane factor (OMF) lipoprotein
MVCLAGSLLVGALSGCTSFSEYIHNGFKVGPNYAKPPAPVAKEWIDANDKRVRTEKDDLSKWWTVFNDPVLDNLVCRAYRQNISLRQAGFQVLVARALRNIAIGNLFPQTQEATGDFTRHALSVETANSGLGGLNNPSFSTFRRFYQQWDFGFTMAWELDFWGRFRRAIEADNATLDASVENYDDVLVTLLGEVASGYVNIRTLQQQIQLTRANVELQRKTLEIARARFKGGTATELDVDQAQSNLSQTESQIPQLEQQLRQAGNQLCTLLGIPPVNLTPLLGTGAIPTAPVEVAVGIPADLLRRRPDVRRAERQAAAQSAQIGIAEADFYPRISLDGTLDYSAQHFQRLFRPSAFNGTFGPAFTWEILNYGRILSNVRAQDAQFQALVATYQNTVLTAAQDVENGLVQFLKSQEAVKELTTAVEAAQKAVFVALAQYKGGTVDFNRVALLEQNLVQFQNLLAQAQGNVALGLINVYRALGGGWQIRYTGCEPADLPPPAPPPAEARPAPSLAQEPVPAPARLGEPQAQ